MFNCGFTFDFPDKKGQFQAELKNEIDKIKQCPDILVFADKTSNIYNVNTKDHQRLLKENIIVIYKSAYQNRKNYNKETIYTTKVKKCSSPLQ